MHAQVVIPARFDSGRLPGKALLPLLGKPVLQHVWERARAADIGPTPIVATDDGRVASAARAFGAPVVLTTADCRCGSERVAEVARGLSAELVVNLQGDEALFEPALLGRLVAVFADPGISMATLVAPLLERARLDDPTVVKAVLDSHDDALYFSRAAIPPPGREAAAALGWWGHLGVYAFRREFLLEMYLGTEPAALELAEGLEQLRVLDAGRRIRAVRGEAVMFGINTAADLERAGMLLTRAAKPGLEAGE